MEILQKIYEEQDREIRKKQEKLKNNSMHTNQDLSAFTKKMNQRRVITQHIKRAEQTGITIEEDEGLDFEAAKLQEQVEAA